MLTIPTSSAMLEDAGLGCLCALFCVFTTKTSGVQHQIQDALVVFVDHFNLVPLLLCQSSTCQLICFVCSVSIHLGQRSSWAPGFVGSLSKYKRMGSIVWWVLAFVGGLQVIRTAANSLMYSNTIRSQTRGRI